MGELQHGVVKWFNDAKGFGFIEHPSGRDVFVHYSVIECEGFKTLKDGEEVEYELSEGDKGLHAKRVVRTNAPVKAAKQIAKEGDATREASLVAPTLETGSLNPVSKTTASMIEFEVEHEAGDKEALEALAAAKQQSLENELER